MLDINLKTIDLNIIVTELLQHNKKARLSEQYRNAYIDGVLDYHNKMKRAKDAQEKETINA